eukprot:CAMPEP_0119311968 /NCGR_PEP_ID=MMETSP1333-20130426/24575_1 /TAXON_ID=418940 /ORGANISM="Scyphosphaera apsteinii, Strain RCC1455" /LENGTH=79 /DNA_ID=CAMNT_0007316489 /DNA_START=35 /DNA_END=271 /DNA_ORIENTATION=-
MEFGDSGDEGGGKVGGVEGGGGEGEIITLGIHSPNQTEYSTQVLLIGQHNFNPAIPEHLANGFVVHGSAGLLAVRSATS